MTTQEQQSPLTGLDAQQRAERVPKQYFDIISNRTKGNLLQPALIFTEDNIKSIKRYVDYVLRLPKTEAEITRAHDLTLLGLDAKKVDRLYTGLRTHVDQWDVLEQETKTLGAHLELFADKFISSGEVLIEKLQATEAYRSLKGRLNDVVDEVSLARVGLSDLGEGDREQIVSLGDYLDLIKKDIDQVKVLIGAVKERAEWFADAVVKQLRPDIDALNGQIKEVNPEKAIADLREQITPLDREIKQLKGEYDTMVGLAFTGLFFGPVGGGITGGIFGAKAEAIRARRNRLIQQRDLLARQVASINPMIGVFEQCSSQIADLTFRLIEVQTAAKNLEDVWNVLGVYAKQSGEELELIDNDVRLAIFALRFERVVRPWRGIRDISAQLSKIFNTTMDEINEQGASQ